MFGNKKNRSVPPRPRPPTPDQILEDLKCVSDEDCALNILRNEKIHGDDLHFPTNANDPANVYRKVKTYLNVTKQLKLLDESLYDNAEQLRNVEQDIMKLASEIKCQAKAALIH